MGLEYQAQASQSPFLISSSRYLDLIRAFLRSLPSGVRAFKGFADIECVQYLMAERLVRC